MPAEDFTEAGDFVYGLPFYPSRSAEIPHAMTPMNENWPAQAPARVDDYVADLAYDETAKQVFSSLSARQGDRLVDALIGLAGRPGVCPLRLLQSSDNLAYLAPVDAQVSDMQVAGTLARAADRLRDVSGGAALEQLPSSSERPRPGAAEPEPDTAVYSAQMFDAACNEVCQYITPQFEVLVPRFLAPRRLRYLAELVQECGPARLRRLGFQLDGLLLFADVQRFVSQYRPGLVYDAATRRYYYMPLVLDAPAAQQSLTF